MLSGHWSVEEEGKVLAEALKPNALFRAFEIHCDSLDFTAQAPSVFSRGYEIVSEGSVVGTLRTVHAFTRRATIECQQSVPELAQVFAFWLAVITWRRSASNGG
jgi:hypothetical protein